MIAALFVAKGGVYFGLPNVDPWDEARDARLYAGPWPVVAHPPCQRYEEFHSKEERRRSIRRGTIQRLSKRQRAATPIAFRDLLISIAESAVRRESA